MKMEIKNSCKSYTTKYVRHEADWEVEELLKLAIEEIGSTPIHASFERSGAW